MTVFACKIAYQSSEWRRVVNYRFGEHQFQKQVILEIRMKADHELSYGFPIRTTFFSESSRLLPLVQPMCISHSQLRRRFGPHVRFPHIMHWLNAARTPSRMCCAKIIGPLQQPYTRTHTHIAETLSNH